MESMGNMVQRAEQDFDNMALILGQRDRIRETFRKYTADVSYDLRVYRGLFDDIDRKLEKEPQPARAIAELGVLTSVGRRFMEFFDDTLEELKRETAGFTREEHERHGYYFRKQVWDIVRTSPFLTLTNTKPRGYLGDPEMMALLYENDYRGSTTFGKLMHKHPVESTAAQGVRNRRAILREKLVAAGEERRASGRKLRFLSVASGSAYEVQDLYRDEAGAFDRFDAVLLDQDTAALGGAMAALAEIRRQKEEALGGQALSRAVTTLNESVRTMLRTPDLPARWGRFDFVYSMGLFDYLTPPVARAVAAKLYDLLLPGGQLVLGNYHVGNPTRAYMDYWMDWGLYYRAEEDMLSLVPQSEPVTAHVFFEPSGAQMFLHVTKP